MSKGVLQFNLPEEQDEFVTAQKGIDYKIAIQEFDNFMRNIIKHGEEKDQSTTFETVRDEFHRILAEQDIELW